MPTALSSLVVKVGGDNSGLSAAMRGAIVPVNALTNNLHRLGAASASGFGGMLRLAGAGAVLGAGMAALRSVFGGVSDAFRTAANAEQNQVAFETMLGSADKAKTVLMGLTQFAASTPFELPGVITSARQLLAFGVSAETLTPTLRSIGDVAAGVGAPLEEIAAIYGKISSKGKVQAEEINQLSERGIPIIRELAKQYGITTGEVSKLVEKGKVGFPQVQKAFTSLSGEGGQFQNLMEKQSKTLAGLWSNFTDTVSVNLGGLVTTIGEAFNLKGALGGLNTGLAAAFGTVSDWVKRAAPVVKGFALATFDVFAGIYGVVAPPIGRVVGFVSRAFRGLAPHALAAGRTIWTGLTSAFKATYGTVAPVVARIGRFISDNWRGIVVTTTRAGAAIWGSVKAVWGAVRNLAGFVWGGITAAWDWGTTLITGKTISTGASVAAAFRGIVSGARWLADKFTLSLNVMSFGLTNWRALVDAAFLSVRHTVIRFGAETKHLFTEAVPAVLNWFADNWKNILRDVFDWTGTVFSNLASNIVKILTSIPELVSGAVDFSDLWTPLTEGFKRTSKELIIPDRQIGALERSAGEAAAAARKAYADGQAKFLDEQKRKSDAAAKAITDGIDRALRPSVPPVLVDARLIPPVLPPEFDPLKIKALVDPDPLAVKIKPEVKGPKAILLGSAEALAARVKPPRLSAPAPAPSPPPPPPPVSKRPDDSMMTAVTKGLHAAAGILAPVVTALDLLPSAFERVASDWVRTFQGAVRAASLPPELPKLDPVIAPLADLLDDAISGVNITIPTLDLEVPDRLSPGLDKFADRMDRMFDREPPSPVPAVPAPPIQPAVPKQGWLDKVVGEVVGVAKAINDARRSLISDPLLEGMRTLSPATWAVGGMPDPEGFKRLLRVTQPPAGRILESPKEALMALAPSLRILHDIVEAFSSPPPAPSVRPVTPAESMPSRAMTIVSTPPPVTVNVPPAVVSVTPPPAMVPPPPIVNVMPPPPAAPPPVSVTVPEFLPRLDTFADRLERMFGTTPPVPPPATVLVAPSPRPEPTPPPITVNVAPPAVPSVVVPEPSVMIMPTPPITVPDLLPRFDAFADRLERLFGTAPVTPPTSRIPEVVAPAQPVVAPRAVTADGPQRQPPASKEAAAKDTQANAKLLEEFRKTSRGIASIDRKTVAVPLSQQQFKVVTF